MKVVVIWLHELKYVLSMGYWEKELKSFRGNSMTYVIHFPPVRKQISIKNYRGKKDC